MNALGLVARNVRHFWRTEVGVVLGAAAATAVLVGALAVGDSVRGSLHALAGQRIGRVDAVLAGGDRFFKSDLADRIAPVLAGSTVAPVCQLRGIAKLATGESRAGIIDVYGVDRRFFALAPAPGGRGAPTDRKVFLNRRLATHLGVGVGDEILLRVEKPSFVPRDMVLSTIEDISVALRVEVSAVLGADDFGAFSLRASQIPPFAAFVSLAWLQKEVQLAGAANLLLVGGQSGANVVARCDAAVRAHWTSADAGLRLTEVEGSEVYELSSERLFIDQPVIDAVAKIDRTAVGVLTYFVNALRHGDRTTPYSMVTAVGPLVGGSDRATRALLALVPSSGAAINRWLADDLGVKAGDTIDLDYFVMGSDLRLREKTHQVRVESIVPLTGAAADRSLMPEFPGLHDTENCRDWEPGIPLQLDRIRDQDEKYWDVYRGTPKAFVGLELGKKLWSNRFGNLTAVRGPKSAVARLRAELPKQWDPASIGLFFRDLRGPALAASTPATDFGGLFLGLSLFLIIAALMLTALLFVFGIEQRASEIGVLLALGFRPARVRRLFLAEGLVLASLGAAAGVGLGMLYTKGVLYGLGTLWSDAVGATSLEFHAGAGTVVGGALGAVFAAVLAMWLALRHAFRLPAIELLQSKGGIPAADVRPSASRRAGVVALVALVLAVVVVVTGSSAAAGAFFGAGALLLVAGLAGVRWALGRIAATSDIAVGSVAGLGLRNAARRPGRSLTTIGLLACGTFLVVAVQAYRLGPPTNAAARDSGTGGFVLFGRSTLPVLRDLSTETGREAFGLEPGQLADAAIVPFRVQDGDDASCLNLSLPQRPRLLGVNAAELARRRAFRFADVLDTLGPVDSPWSLLDAGTDADVVPAIADQASVTWALHKKIGDTVDYRDQHGRLFRVRIVATLAGSILQGDLIVSERRFQERYPSASGYRVFLIDAPAARSSAIAAALTRGLEDLGLELTPTGERLQEFNAVQNTYLMIFQLLGGLGLLLGSLGLGAVVLRNALERRSELALCSAVGFAPGAARRLIWVEHLALLGGGLAIGAFAASVAVVPGFLASGASVALQPIVLLVGVIAASGLVWVWSATRLATRGDLISALRSE